MMTLQEARAQLYAAMARETAILAALTPETSDAVLGSDAWAAYRAAQQQAAQERDVSRLLSLVGRMNAAIDELREPEA